MTELINELFGDDDEGRKKKTTLPVEKTAKLMVDFFSLAGTGVVLAWSVRPFLSLKMILPFPYFFPFPIVDLVYFVLAYVLVVFLLCLTATGHIAVDTSFVLLASRLCRRITSLAESWTALDLSTPSLESSSKTQIKTSIKAFTKEHYELLRYNSDNLP
jgi:hypothetical protein